MTEEKMKTKLERIKESFFRRVNRLIEFTTKEQIEDVKEQTNKVLTDAELEIQSKWVKDTLLKREEKLQKQRPAKELSKEKEAFRLRMYQATMKRSHETENTLEK